MKMHVDYFQFLKIEGLFICFLTKNCTLFKKKKVLFKKDFSASFLELKIIAQSFLNLILI